MTPIAVLDIVGVLAILTALIILWRGWTRALDSDARALLAGLLVLTLVGNLSNALEWSGIAEGFDPVEDNIELLEPVLWIFFFYAFLKAADISDRERAEAALRASEKRYRSLFDDSPISIWEEDFSALKNYLDHLRDASIEDFRSYFQRHPEEVAHCASLVKVVDVNKAALTLYGAESKDELLKALDIVFTEDAYPGFTEELIGIAQGKHWVEVDAVNRTLEGEDKVIIVTWRVVPGYDDSLSRCIVSIRDVTERERAEQALRESKVLLSRAEEMAHLGSWKWDLETDTFTLSEEWKRIHGCHVDQLSREELFATAHPADLPRIQQAFDRALAGIEPYDVEHRIIRWDDGAERTIRAHGEIVLDQQGDPIRMYGTSRDVTDRKRMEEQLHQQEQLAAVGQLAAGIAHDFRNRLAPILLYAQMDLARDDLPPDLAVHLRVIIAESKKAADLVQQILDFSSRSMIDRQPIDLHAFVADVIDNVLRPGIPENIELALETTPGSTGPFTVKADRGRIRQVLTNLAVNARDAMPTGGELRFILDRVEVHDNLAPPVAEMQPGAWIRLSVTDTGTGISDEVLPHIFEPFFTTKDIDKGKGLGLPQVYGIMRQHEGYIDVETALGEGTTFLLYLPAHGHPIPKPDDTSARPLLIGNGETILLVEDHQALREAGCSILESLGYRVVTAGDGREALTIYQAGQRSKTADDVDLLITDLVMPEMGGQRLLRALQRLKPDIIALAVTGHALEHKDRMALKAIGFREVVHKPFDLEGLAKAVRRALDGHTP